MKVIVNVDDIPGLTDIVQQQLKNAHKKISRLEQEIRVYKEIVTEAMSQLNRVADVYEE